MMKRLFFALVFVFPAVVFAQSQDSTYLPLAPNDSLAINIEGVADDVLLLADTAAPNFASNPYDLEYVPADETAEVLTERLTALQNEIPLTYNEKVHGFINYFTIRDREHTRNVLRKRDVYFPLFEKYLKENDMPEELKYLSVIESALIPTAVSRARAVGLWQFMSYTGKYVGLKIDWYVDERMDPEKSTQAACKYLSQLYSIFGDWELALAAYNTGPGNVKRAVRKAGGGKKTFWEIYPFLPKETRAYVPQYVAMIYALNHAPEHNLFVDGIEEPLRSDTLAVKGYLHMETLAKLTNTCLDDYRKLNPSILHDALPDGRDHIIRIPIAAKEELEKNRFAILDSASKANKAQVEALAKNAVGNTMGRDQMVYHVKSGDVLGTIARRYNVRVEDMKKWNNLQSNNIRVGQKLNIWLKPGQEDRQPVASTVRVTNALPSGGSSKTYTVQPGDTLWDISKKQGLSVEKIKSLNNLKSNELKPGQKLIIS